MTVQEKRLAMLDKIRASTDQIEREDIEAIEARKAAGGEVRANEGMSSGQDGYGQDYIPTDLSSQIIYSQRNVKSLMSLLPPPFPSMPSNVWTIPVEGADNTWYATSETSGVVYDGSLDVTKSKAGTDDLVLTAKKYSTSVWFSAELEEDAIIAMRPFLITKFGKSYTELLDKVILLGDVVTAATGNINMDDEAPTAGTYFLHQDGIIKKARTNSMTADLGTLDLADFRGLRALMGLKGLNPADLVCAMDIKTYFKLLGLGQVETLEKYGINATIINGVLAYIDGVEVLASSLIPLTEADGKMSFDTPANNVKGRLVLIHKPSIVHAFKRQMSIVTEYLPRTDQFCMTAHVRYAFQMWGTDGAAYGYNITVE